MQRQHCLNRSNARADFATNLICASEPRRLVFIFSYAQRQWENVIAVPSADLAASCFYNKALLLSERHDSLAALRCRYSAALWAFGPISWLR